MVVVGVQAVVVVGMVVVAMTVVIVVRAVAAACIITDWFELTESLQNQGKLCSPWVSSKHPGMLLNNYLTYSSSTPENSFGAERAPQTEALDPPSHMWLAAPNL